MRYVPLTIQQISAYTFAMRRRDGKLVPFEAAILAAALDIRRRGSGEFFGFQIAKALQDRGDTRDLAGYGTVYRALGRLERLGCLKSRWEDAEQAIAEHRPLRRLYEVTAAGKHALAEHVPARTAWGGRIAQGVT